MTAMCEAAESNVFPLPLVAFERYMLRDDTSQYPMTFCFLFDFRGEFNRSALDEALYEALRRHPLFTARIERVPKKGTCWVAAAGVRPRLDWGPLDAPLECPSGDVIALRQEAGLRLWVRQGGGRARLTLQIHHACADGVGTLHFIGDLLAAYAAQTGADREQVRLVPLDPAALADRDRFEVEPPEPNSQWEVLKASGAEAVRCFGRRPAPLAAPARSETAAMGDASLAFPGTCSHTFDAETTAALAAAARRNEATVNDVLLRDAFRLLADWNATRQPGNGRRWLRINMPTNLRRRNDRPMAAANAVSYTFLDRRPGDCLDRDRLLDGIRRETEFIKYWSMGLIHLGGIRLLLRVPGLFRLATRRRCMASLVVSNMGDLTRHFRTPLHDEQGRVRAGDVVLQRFTGAPPVRPLTRAALLVARCAGQLTLGLRCDRQLFTASDARSLLNQYVDLLRETATRG